jgi:hypothetical protein
MSSKNKPKLNDPIIKILHYFSYFGYAPSFDQIREFLSIRLSQYQLKQTLIQMIKNKQLMSGVINIDNCLPYRNSNYVGMKEGKLGSVNCLIYTMPPHRIYLDNRITKYQETKAKEHIIRYYLKTLSIFPQIRLVGYSGSMAAYNANKSDDIDLFIITKNKRLWTSRFICIILAYAFYLKRNRSINNAPNKVCLNMFIDERDLTIPKYKHNIYIGHEILQMRPIIVRGDIYQKFISANKWVYKLFPNAEEINSKLKTQMSKPNLKTQNFIYKMFHISCFMLNKAGDAVEYILKNLQLYLINRHKTTEIITDTQLWFFPEDFEKSIINQDFIS